jgi:hypothetical protein
MDRGAGEDRYVGATFLSLQIAVRQDDATVHIGALSFFEGNDGDGRGRDNER